MDGDQYRVEPWIPTVTIGIEAVICFLESTNT